ncbi:hypothetical protein [Aquipuribacter hungaricus]|uniref:Secreted protein n=1 Tax=Aquipuribacter hungaricus TaxID=545624 RepID=A0ABV7WEE9_9MICO
MSHDLAGALRRDVPEPPRVLDPDALIRTHRERRQRRRAAVVAGSLALAAVGGSAAVLGSPDRTQPGPAGRPATAQVSALEDTVALPQEWRQLRPFLPERASQVATMEGDAAAYLWADEDRLCLAVLFGVDGEVPGGGVPTGRDGCTPADALLEDGLVLVAQGSSPAGTFQHLVAVLPDGYTEATLGTRTVTVTGNAAVFGWDYVADVGSLSRATGGLLVEGPGRPSVTLPLP